MGEGEKRLKKGEGAMLGGVLKPMVITAATSPAPVGACWVRLYSGLAASDPSQ
jgi:hypothetical protein